MLVTDADDLREAARWISDTLEMPPPKAHIAKVSPGMARPLRTLKAE
jgi:hypothetical protein